VNGKPQNPGDTSPSLSGHRNPLSGREPSISPRHRPEFRGKIERRGLILAYTQKKQIDGLIRQANTTQRRAFACDCALHVLPLFEKVYPNDTRPRDAIEAAQRYSAGDKHLELATFRQEAGFSAYVARDERQLAARSVAWSASWTCALFDRNNSESFDTWSASVAARFAAWAVAVEAGEIGTVLTSEIPDVLDARWADGDTSITAWGAERQWQLDSILGFVNQSR